MKRRNTVIQKPVYSLAYSEYSMCVKQINIYISERTQMTTTQKSKKGNKKAYI